MKVLILNPSCSAYGYTHQLCNAIGRQDAEVHCMTSPVWELMNDGQPISYKPILFFYRLGMKWTGMGTRTPGLWKLVRLVEHFWGMLKFLIAARQYDVLHVQWLIFPALDLGWLWLAGLFRPVVYTVHDLYPHQDRFPWFTRFVFRILYHVPDRLIVHTDYTIRGLVRDFNVPANKIVKIRHGNYNYLFDIAEKSPPEPPGRPVVLFFGNMRQHKGFDTLIRSMVYLRKILPDVKLLVAGASRWDMSPYFTLIQELGLSEVVEFKLEFVKDSDIPRYFNQASVVVLPYRSIDQSGVAVLACTMGKAIVATRVGGLEEIVQEANNGLLVPVDDPEKLSAALATILQNDSDRQEYELNSKAYAQEFLDWDTLASETLGVYGSVSVPQL